MERNVDKIKRLEHELGRWHKKVADTAKDSFPNPTGRGKRPWPFRAAPTP